MDSGYDEFVTSYLIHDHSPARNHLYVMHLSESDFEKARKTFGLDASEVICQLMDEGWEIGWNGSIFWLEQSRECWDGDDVLRNLVQMGHLNVRDFPGLFTARRTVSRPRMKKIRGKKTFKRHKAAIKLKRKRRRLKKKRNRLE